MNEKLYRSLSLILIFVFSCLCLYFAVLHVGIFDAPPLPSTNTVEQAPIFKTIRLPSIKLRTFAIAPDQSLWVASPNYLHRISTKGIALEQYPLAVLVGAMTISSNNTIYLASTQQITKFVPGPPPITKQLARLNKRAFITSICLSGQQLFIADAGNKQLHAMNLQGKLLWSIGGQEKFVIPSPYFDVAGDGNAGVWVVNPGKLRIENYDRNGKYVSVWTAATQNRFLGCCNPAHIALLPRGRFVTLEKGVLRCRIFNPAGQVEKMVAGAEQFAPGKFDYELAVNNRQEIIIMNPSQYLLRVFSAK